MSGAIYAGSFDPWSFGHQYVLDAGLEVFDKVHVLAAINPSKTGTLSPETRARMIAHSINPFEDWRRKQPPFEVGARIVVSCTAGLVVDYARAHHIRTLIRGLRSTSDFEAEFNLYFSNRAIHSTIQTWAVMCPPELLHCSSTYVRTVVGKPNVDFVGTSFLAQALMLGKPDAVGRVFDLIQACSKDRFEAERADLRRQDLNAALQAFFSILINLEPQIAECDAAQTHVRLESHLNGRRAAIEDALARHVYPSRDVAFLWAILVLGVTPEDATLEEGIATLEFLASLARRLGRSRLPLFDTGLVRDALEELHGPPDRARVP